MRYITSNPATTAVISSRPLLPRSCATARPGGSKVAPGCTPAPGLVRLSDSNACASVPLAKSRRRRLHQRSLRAEDAAASARPDTLRIGGDDPAPRQAIAQHDHRDRIGDAVLGALYHVRRQVFVTQARRIFGQPNRFVCHCCSLSFSQRYPVMRRNPSRGVSSRTPTRYGAPAKSLNRNVPRRCKRNR